MKLAGDWFQNAETQAVLSILNEAGKQAFMVGGCVRNALLGVEVSDIDISTDANPETVTNLAQKAGYKVIPTGIDHGTVTVTSGGIPHEITTYRKDIETDGRRAVVAFSTSMHEDAKRRDFTMNALYANASGDVIDPLGGIDDLQARRVRFIGSASDRIREDYLRILRFFRFTAWYGDANLGFDADALAAIGSSLAGLETLSKERIGSEVKKLLLASNPSTAIAVMQQTGVLNAIIEGADSKALAILVHNEASIDVAPDFPRRLASLGGRNVGDALRLSKSDVRDTSAVRNGATEIGSPKELGYRLGAKLGLDAELLRSALLETSFDMTAASIITAAASEIFPIKAADLIEVFQGAALGNELRRLEDLWISSEFSLSKAELLES